MFTKTRLAMAAIVVLTVAILVTVPAPTTSSVAVSSELAKPGEFVSAAPMQKGTPAQILTTGSHVRRVRVANISAKPITSIEVGWVATPDWAATSLASAEPLPFKPEEVVLPPNTAKWVELDGLSEAQVVRATGLKGARISPGILSVRFADGTTWRTDRIIENHDPAYRAKVVGPFRRTSASAKEGSCKPPKLGEWLLGLMAPTSAFAQSDGRTSTCKSTGGLFGFDCDNGPPCNMTACEIITQCDNQQCQ